MAAAQLKSSIPAASCVVSGSICFPLLAVIILIFRPQVMPLELNLIKLATRHGEVRLDNMDFLVN